MKTSNGEIARALREAAALLELQGANPFRVSAYRKGADTIADLNVDLRKLFEDGGMDALIALPHIGKGIAAAIVEMIAMGRWGRLERLRGELDPVQRLQGVPGIGPLLAERIYESLHIDSLESLEAAAHDGRLAGVSGIGKGRIATLKSTLAGMLGRPRAVPVAPVPVPPVDMLLDVDDEYRRLAEAGELPTIAPRRFNPNHERWLPIMHATRGDWHFTALYSNSAQAHALRRTRDWVIVYFYDGDHRENQSTVVTETRGAFEGLRVVRGRELECHAVYAQNRNRTREDSRELASAE